MAKAAKTEKKKFKMPHAYVIIICMILLFAVLSYIIPAGTYDKMEVNGREVIDPASFHFIDQTPVGLWDVVLSIPQGLVKQAGIMFMIIVIAGSVEIINQTGALEASIGRLAHNFKDRPYIILPLLLACFVAMGAVGVGNAIVAFVPLGLMIALGMGADACIGVAMVGMGMNLGFTGGSFVASTTGTAQTIVGLPMFSGFGLRLIMTVVLWAAGSVFMVRYVKKIQKNPQLSAVYGVEGAVREMDDVEMPELTKRRILVLLAFLVGLAFVVYGAIKSWSANDAIPAVFLSTGVVCGLIYGFGPSKICEIFVNGAKKITFGALIVGISAGIGIVMTKGNIIHTVVYGLSSLLVGMPKAIAAIVMYVINIIINCFLTSGSGQAAAVIPILGPVGEAIGLNQQIVVLAFNLGDGFTNQILPMSSVTMASIAMGGIPYDKWLKFIGKWLGINLLIGAIFLVIATMINYGPF